MLYLQFIILLKAVPQDRQHKHETESEMKCKWPRFSVAVPESVFFWTLDKQSMLFFFFFFFF